MRLVEESVKRSLKESTKTCETVEDIEDLWYQIATRAKSHLHAEIAGLNIVEENLDPKSVADPNPLAETRAEVVDRDLFVDIHVDPVFYDLKPDWPFWKKSPRARTAVFVPFCSILKVPILS